MAHVSLTGPQVTRRAALKAGGLAGAALAAACAPGASPQEVPFAAGGPAGEWQAQWESLIAAAKREGKVVVQTPVGAGFREALEAFAKAFPGVEPEQQAFADSATYTPKILEERKAGIYTFDVAATPGVGVLRNLKPEGVWDPLRPLLFRPDVLEDQVWADGFEGRWSDTAKELAFAFQRIITRPVYINTNLVKEAEFRTLDDLVDPKWRGKIAVGDIRQGYVRTPVSVLRQIKGDTFVKKLMVDQQPEFIRDRRQLVEALVRGRQPIGYGLHPRVLQEFREQGVAGHVKNLAFVETDYTGGDVVAVFNRAPHPNAAKLFANWLLTKEGGIAWSTNTKANSARLDVPIVDEETAARPGVSYQDPTREAVLHLQDDADKFLNDLLAGRS